MGNKKYYTRPIITYMVHLCSNVRDSGASACTVHLRVDFWGGRPSRTPQVNFQMDKAVRTRVLSDESVIGVPI